METNSFSDYMKANGLNYNDSYLVSSNFLSDVLVDYGPFDLIIDFHRDAVPQGELLCDARSGKDYAPHDVRRRRTEREHAEQSEAALHRRCMTISNRCSRVS